MVRLEDTKRAVPLFRSVTDTMVWTCLDNVMGTVYADDQIRPQTAAACLGEFVFLAGKADSLFLEKLGTCCPKMGILIPLNGEWPPLIERTYGNLARQITRYSFLKEAHIWDLAELERIAAGIPEGMELRQIDEELYRYAKNHEWTKDWTAQFPTYEDYAEKGLGFAILKESVPVAGASSYCAGNRTIDIQVDTRPDFRRRGLALICGASLIAECERRGLYPSWDAHNPESAALAQKLGYHMDKAYQAYVLEEPDRKGAEE